MREYFLQLATYHRWAYRKLFESLAPLSDEAYGADAGLPFRSIHGTLNHSLLADRLWRARFEGRAPPYSRLDLELETDRTRLASALDQEALAWSRFIAGLDEAELTRDLTYTTTEGVSRTFPVVPLLAHVFNHGTHHRGQVTAIITRLGFDYPVMDLPYFLAEAPER